MTILDDLYERTGEDYSPVETDDMPDVAGAVIERASQGKSPFDSSNPIPAAFVPRNPDPALGGMPGSTNVLGRTTGIRLSRAFRQRFGGQTLVVPAMGAHPIQGPVGYSTRTDRLVYGVAALNGPDIPTDDSVGLSVVAMTGQSLADATRGNANYV